MVAAVVSQGKWINWVESAIPFLDGQKILELGHGPGHLITKLALSGKLVFGIDTSPQMASIASDKLKRSSLPINLSIARAQQLPFCSEVFDQIVATFPTEYIFEDRTLKEIYRVLSQGGSAIIIPVAYITGRSLIDKATSWLFRITGQAPPFDHRYLEPINSIGFDLRINKIVLNSSEVILIEARKPKIVE